MKIYEKEKIGSGKVERFDRFFLWADDLCGYGKHLKPADVWK